MADVNDLAAADVPAPADRDEQGENLARPDLSAETIYVIQASPRKQPRALPEFPNPTSRPEGAEAPLVLEFHSEVSKGIDLALGRVPKRDTERYLRAISGAGNRSIHCEIDDAGGDGDAAVAIALALLRHPYRVTARIAGRCSSAAVFIALAADQRRIAPAGSVLIHRAARICTRTQTHALMRLPAADREAISDQLNDIDDATISLLKSRLGVSEETARAWMREDRKWSAAEALQLRFVDHIDI
ncbi:ATP-dependent protease ClpP protease subunit [Bradyrhizobium huanghuaihaiense]